MLDWTFDIVRHVDDIPTWIWLGMSLVVAGMYVLAKAA
jgi:hypothetical protein